MTARLTEARLDLAGGWVDRTPLLEWAAQAQPRGSVMLVTLEGARFGPEATRVALEATTESGRSLVIANIIRLSCPPNGPATASAALCDPAIQACLLGLEVHFVRIRTASPSAALVEFATECQPSLVVLGAYPAAAPERDRKAYDKLTRALSGNMPCLVWHPRWVGQPATEAGQERCRPGPEPPAGSGNHDGHAPPPGSAHMERGRSTPLWLLPLRLHRPRRNLAPRWPAARRAH